MSQLFSSFTLRGVSLRNRVAMSPMCMYSAGEDGIATDFHLAHLAARATGGVGLIVTEATAVEARGRISTNDLGLWDDAQVEALARLVRLCKAQGAAMCTQLAHAGRKAWTPTKGAGPFPSVAPSAIPFDAEWALPHELTLAELNGIVSAYRAAAERAVRAGFDAIEAHANRRTDAYGGPLEYRARMLLRVVDTVRAAVPESMPLLVRLSSTDWIEGGLTIDDQVQVARWLNAHGVDLVDCSSGGITSVLPPVGPGYQVPFAEKIRREAGIATMCVGLITTPEMAEEIVRNGRADLVALGRELLRSPHWPLHAARALGHDIAWPRQYLRAKPAI
ncbi:MAG: NADH:flavin oxidoreductase/NADH oxidase [candidate division NC10 bacterium]|nr:NADH:flavin oxidoreductase/NADH oxidase [candidate division NC10 bacterium]